MEQTDEEQTAKPQAGAWNDVKGYPQRLTFEIDKPVLVTFDADFDGPKEMPSTDDKSVYYIFECTDGQGTKSSIMTSAWTMLNRLKSHEPINGKSLLITQKLVKGRKMYYVQREGTYNAPKPERNDEEIIKEFVENPTTTPDSGIKTDGTM